MDASTPISANEIESPIATVRGVILLVLVEYAAMSGTNGSIQGDRTLNIPKPKAMRGNGNVTIANPRDRYHSFHSLLTFKGYSTGIYKLSFQL